MRAPIVTKPCLAANRLASAPLVTPSLPRADQDLLPLEFLRHAASVPALEALLDRVANELVEADPRHQVIRCPPMLLEHGFRDPTPLTKTRRHERQTPVQRQDTSPDDAS